MHAKKEGKASMGVQFTKTDWNGLWVILWFPKHYQLFNRKERRRPKQLLFDLEKGGRMKWNAVGLFFLETQKPMRGLQGKVAADFLLLATWSYVLHSESEHDKSWFSLFSDKLLHLPLGRHNKGATLSGYPPCPRAAAAEFWRDRKTRVRKWRKIIHIFSRKE